MNPRTKAIAICVLLVLACALIYVWQANASDAVAISIGGVSALVGISVAVIERVRSTGGSWTDVFAAVVGLAGLVVAIDLPVSRALGY